MKKSTIIGASILTVFVCVALGGMYYLYLYATGETEAQKAAAERAEAAAQKSMESLREQTKWHDDLLRSYSTGDTIIYSND